MSYTLFQRRFPKLDKNVYKAGESVKLSLLVRNQGNFEGTETIQVYMRDCVSSVSWPRKNLIAWKKVTLKPREEKLVEFELPYESFAIVNRKCETVVEPGDFEVLVGSSSRNCDLNTLKFTYE
jgi:beta-glucosidase